MCTVKTDYDVIVCGGGPSGIASAIASARSGMRTLMIEKYGFAGGMATTALVNPFAGYQFQTKSGNHASLIGGIFKEIVQKLHLRGAFGTRLTTSSFDEEVLKIVYDELLASAGVNILYHAMITGVSCIKSRIASVNVQSKSSLEVISGRVFIDATGDGDLAKLSGCNYQLGRKSDNAMQPATLSFRMAGVDKTRFLEQNSIQEARQLVDGQFKKALETCELDYPWRDFIHFYDYPREDVLHFNMTRIFNVNGTRSLDLSRAEIEGRMQAFRLSDWLKKSSSYFAKGYISKIACQVGIRETRHVKGYYTVTSEDIVQGRKFEDGIARSAYFIDIHSPNSSGFDHEIKGSNGMVANQFMPPENDWYEVPYRSVVPVDVENLLLPCRALSATHEAAAAIRVMATMTGIGQACGYAAVETVRNKCSCIEINTSKLRTKIAYIDQCPDKDPIWGDRFRDNY